MPLSCFRSAFCPKYGTLVPLVPSHWLQISVFFCERVWLACVCALCETYFVRAVVTRFGRRVGILTGVFLLAAPGMFVSSTGTTALGLAHRFAYCASSLFAIFILHVSSAADVWSLA